MSKMIRISCAGLCSIKIGDKYLLIQNSKARKNGNITYGPVGGALEYMESSEEFLNKLGFIPERKTRDLRMSLPIENLDIFDDWFRDRVGRETTSIRELIEELVDEEKILDKINIEDIIEEYSTTIYLRDKLPNFDTESVYYFEIYNITLPKYINDYLLKSLENDNSTGKFFTRGEILKPTNVKISDHSRFIIDYEERVKV